jgi:beta-1,4-N-acetylgalactosaminyltransferase 2
VSRVERAKALMMGPYGAPLRLAHRAVVSGQLGAVAAADRLRARRDSERDEWLADQLTVTAKTFLRPATARRFVRSARRTFTGRIVLADDSPEPMAAPDDRTTVLALPFNSGVCVGRNAAIAAVTTPYVLVSDDDVVMTAGTDLAGAVMFLEEHPEADAVCATQIELPRWYASAYGDERELFPGHQQPLRPYGDSVGGFSVLMKGPPVYVARTERLRQVPYDENIRMVDHRDFFSSASGRLVFVSSPHLVVFHARTPFNKTYTSYREDVARDLAYLARKWMSAPVD